MSPGRRAGGEARAPSRPAVAGRPGPEGVSRRTAASVLACALALLALWTFLALRGHSPFTGWYYQFAWYSTLVAADAGLAWREKRFPLFGRPRFALSLFLWSVPTWLLFELINFRVANWYYVNVSDLVLLRRLGTATAFATVLPAIFLGHRWMASLGLARRWRGPSFQARRWHLHGLLATGGAFLLLALWRPPVFYPLIWGAVTLLLEPWNYRREPESSLFGDVSRGRYGRIVRLLAGGLVVGLVWEALNAPAATRWIYTVPGLEEGKLFEMPLPGYLGFPVFALDCFVIYQVLVHLGIAVPGWRRERAERRERARRFVPPPRLRTGRVVLGAALAAVFSLLVTAGVDRYTVDSFAPSLEELLGVDAERTEALRDAGIGSVEELTHASPRRLAELLGVEPEHALEMVEVARLAALRGIGVPNLAALRDARIRSVCDLATADWAEASSAVRARRADPHAGRPARVRVWIRAAREECPEGVPEEGRDGSPETPGAASPEG